MLELSRIIAGRNEHYKLVSKIKSFEIIPDALKKHFFTDTVFYTDIDNSIQTANKNDLCLADYSKSVANIGNTYKIENKYIKGVFT